MDQTHRERVAGETVDTLSRDPPASGFPLIALDNVEGKSHPIRHADDIDQDYAQKRSPLLSRRIGTK